MNHLFFIGIDTGTNSSKGVLMDDQGTIVAEYMTEHSMTNPLPNHYEHDADKDWWGDFCLVSKALIKKSGIDPQNIISIGVSALGADCLPVDKDCNPLRKAILYGIDARATDEIEQLTNLYGIEQIRKWYGRPLCSSDVMPKILWIKNKEPEIYNKTHKFVTGSTFITAKLTGEYAIDRFLGLASFNPLYDINTWQASVALCKPICRPDQLALVKEATDIAGYVTKKAALETGLKEGTPVIVGTDDSGAEAISAGVVEPGKMMIQFGSSIYIILGTETLIDDDRLWREAFIVPGMCDISAGTNAAGSLTKWYRDTIFSDLLTSEKSGGHNAYESMSEGLETIPPGSENLVTLPYFAGERTPINDPLAKGIICGLSLAHTRAHLYHSALESVGYSINQQIGIMKEHNTPIDCIYCVGGGSKSSVWMQIVTDIIGETLYLPAITVGASYGDALMAAIGIQYPGFESFMKLKNHIKPGKIYTPNTENHELYKKFQAIYDELYSVNKEIMHKL